MPSKGVWLHAGARSVIAAPVIIFLFAPGFRGEAGKYELAVEMFRFTFPYLFFISMTGFAGAVLMALSTVVVAGYGWCGRGFAMRARGAGA